MLRYSKLVASLLLTALDELHNDYGEQSLAAGLGGSESLVRASLGGHERLRSYISRSGKIEQSVPEGVRGRKPSELR